MNPMNSPLYHSALNSLNTMQRKAVESIEGPLMVIAGPGTGKTQLLSTRVGFILNETDMRPFNILCITYTNSGVAAMKKRMVEMIGPDGHDIEVYTFHSFAYKIIDRYKQNRPLEDYRQLDDLEKRTILRDLIEKLDFNSPLKKSVNSVDYVIKFMSQFIDYVKKEKFNIDELIYYYEEEKTTKKSSEEFQYKKKYKEFKAGDLKESLWNEFENKLNKHIQAVHIFKEYQSIIKERKLVDFDDAIIKAIELLKSNEDFKFDFQEQYQYIMIDEFQDTNGAQLELMNVLCDDVEDPNIMVVGDEDQAIYRFQGANLYNIFDFHTKYLSNKSTEEQINKIIVLDQNYRSSPNILSSSRTLIENNTERIKHIIPGKTIEKILIAANKDYNQSTEEVEFIDVENGEDINIPIVKEIEKLITQGVEFKNIAVLFPKNNEAVAFSSYLNIHNFPFELSKNENILEDPLILTYIQIFSLIQKFHKDKTIDKDFIGELLIHPWLNLSLAEIAEFWIDLKQDMNELNEGEKFNFNQYLNIYSKNENIKTIFNHLSLCIKQLKILPPLRYLHYVLDCFQIKEWAISQTNKLEILQKIESLERFIKDYIETNKEILFEDILQRIEAYQREELSIEYSRHIRSNNAIQLMSYHKSKGLEYDYVFVYRAGRYSNQNNINIYIPENIIHKNTNDENLKDIIEQEKRRLLYVAMTRAKRKLYLIDALPDETKEKSKNKFKQEIGILNNENQKTTTEVLVKTYVYNINEIDYIKYIAANKTKLELKAEKVFENSYIEQRIQNFVLSHSSINTYLECPQRFYFEKIISIPSETSFAMTSGNFYHAVLEAYFISIEKLQFKHDLNLVSEIANREVYKYKHFMTDYEFKDTIKALETNLPIMFNQFIIHQTNTKYSIESNLKAQIGSATITGKFDKLDFIEKKIIITDYKTGKITNAKKKLKSIQDQVIIDKNNPERDEIYGGDYWRQAMMYFLLSKENFPDLKIDQFNFVFVIPEDNKIETQTIYPDDESIEYMKNLILDVHQRIKKKEFEACKNSDCSWCSKINLRKEL